ncbi:MAG: AI-2E family transporter [Patescibacteria group bacterium]
MDQKGLTISWGGLWKVALVGLLVWILFAAHKILIALFLALVVSSALNPVVSWLEKRKIPRILGTLTIYIVVIFLIGLLIYAIVPIALSELSTFLSSLGKISGGLSELVDATSLIQAINKSLTKFTNVLLSGSTSLLDIGSKFLGGLTMTISVFVLSFYLTVGKDGVGRFLITIVPSIYEDKAVDLYNKIRRKIGRWLSGQIVLSLVVGLLVFLGLSILGVKYSLLLGILAGIFELIPYVGPIFSGSLAVLVGLTNSLSVGLYTVILFVVIQQLENHVLVPAVTKFTTELEPAVILVGLLIGAQVFGFVGLILAVPITVLLQELLEDWSQSKARRRGLGI